MSETNNPAARLYNVLTKTTDVLSGNKIRDVWAGVFDVDRDDSYQIYRHLRFLLQLLDETERQIKSIPGLNQEPYLKRFGDIKKVLSPTSLDVDWGYKNGYISEVMLASLEFCSERLSASFTESEPGLEELEALAQAITSLQEHILSEEMEPELQSILLDLVESMRRAVYEYSYSGVVGLRENLFLILERLQRFYPIFRQHSEEPVVKEFWEVLTRFDTLTSVYLNVPQILGGFSRLLGS